jgi:[ribosomal protein S18]-alanine N-acetyltransferase
MDEGGSMELAGDQRADTGKSTSARRDLAYAPSEALKPDLAEVQRLDVETYGDEAYSYMVLRQFLDMSGELFQVCRDGNGNVIAYGIVTRSVSQDTGWLLSVVVSLPYRRKGIGTALVKQLLDKAALCSMKNIFLTVAVDNDAAISLYKALGFIVVRVEHHYYGQDENRILMCRS